jgi:NAD(P)-dependent dehydrogenase (short-subunit alcohol dehydrogenase family)
MGKVSMTLKGKTALVTGSSKGLGRAILLRLAAQGANVVVNYSRDENAANEVLAAAEALSAGVITVAADVSGVAGIERLYDATIEAFGQVDIVVANAGMEKVNVAVADVTEEDFDLLFRVNTKGPYFVLREAARRITDNGRIITISSNTTTVPQLGVGLYGSNVCSAAAFNTTSTELSTTPAGFRLAITLMKVSTMSAESPADRASSTRSSGGVRLPARACRQICGRGALKPST